MALSSKLKSRIRVAITNQTDANELIAAIDASGSPAAAVADIATADAIDLATAITLANATKAKVNQLLASLRAAGTLLP